MSPRARRAITVGHSDDGGPAHDDVEAPDPGPLNRDELLAVAERFELEVGDRRDAILEAVAAKRNIRAEDVLADLSRNRQRERGGDFGVVEPDEVEHLLVVVTAFCVEP